MLNSIKISLCALVLTVSLVGSPMESLRTAWAGCPVGDMNGDCVVDLQDLRVFAGQWLDPDSSREGLVAHWKLDGNADDPVGGNHGTVCGSTEWTIGKIDGALDFGGGVGDYVDCGNDSSLNLTNNFSISAWFKTDNTGLFMLICKGNVPAYSDGGAYTILCLPDILAFYVRGINDTEFRYTSTSVSLNEWTHVVGTFGDGNIKIYKDGVFANSKDLGTSTIHSNTGPLGIGADGDGETPFSGIIDDVRIYGRVLSEAEVRELTNLGMPDPNCADLDRDGNVNLSDFTQLAENWQKKGNPLVINEFLASNSSCNPDPQGQYDDWLEIYNTSSVTIDIGGMYLTDDLNEPTSEWWQIPDNNSSATTIGPYGHLLIWADGDTDQGTLHASFAIKNGEDIGLYDADENLIDSISINDQVSDVSYGRYPDAGDTWRFMGFPTPGSQNNGGYLGQVADTEFSHNRGFYVEDFNVTITCDTQGAAIRYTTDSSVPTETHGNPYVAAIPIEGTTCLRAAAFKPGYLPSNVDTQTYIFVSDVKDQSLNGERPGDNWPDAGDAPGVVCSNGTLCGVMQYMNYGMDPEVVNNPAYSGEIEGALLSIPSISISTNSDNLFDEHTGIYVNAYGDGIEWERPASMELIYPDGSEGFQIDMGLRIRGGWSRMGNNPKHAFRCFFRGKYGDSKLRYPLFGEEGVDEFDKIDLRADQNYSWGFCNDTRSTFVHEVFTRDTQGAMGQPYTRSRYYHLYLNGHYWGLFQTQERSEARYAKSYFGGEVDDYDVAKADHGEISYTDGNLDAYERLYNAVATGFTSNTDYFRAQGMNPDGTENPAYEKLLDIDNLIAYNLMCYYFGGIDYPLNLKYLTSLTLNNLYGIYNRSNPDGWKFFIHDAEHTFGMRETSGNNDRTYFYNFVSPYNELRYFNPVRLHQELFDNVEYRIAFADAVHKHMFNGGALTEDKCFDRLFARLAQVEPAIVAESARWGDAIRPFGEGGSWVCGTRSGDPELYRPATKAHWDSSIDRVISWLTGRTDTVFNWIKNRTWLQYPSIDPPVSYINGSPQHGGYISAGDILSMTNPNGSGTVYYTLDGSDPRLIGGNVNPAASTMGGFDTEVINKTTHVKARIKSGSTWSALNEAVYSDDGIAGSLRISEIMYHPADPNTEFIELQNIGTEAINLNLVKFTKGVDFTFGDQTLTPGQHTVIVQDQPFFEAQYGTGLNIAGQYIGRLANAGERIRLEDAIGQTILDFEYSDGWRPITDGDGFSLTIIDPTNSDPNSWGEKDSWRASDYIGGSPGDDTDILPNPGAVVINEVMAHSYLAPDWIELYNTTGASINIGGWFLSDNDANLMKYKIAGNTWLPAGEYIVFYEDQHFDNPGDPGCIVPFKFSENGEEVCLSSAEGDVLTGYREVEDFGASETNISFGRYFKSSTGNFNFVAMDSNTPGWDNAPPKVGPIVISEIMYHPDWPEGGEYNNDDYEYIELHNITDADVNLYDEEGIPWKFTDGIDFTFPAGPDEVTIPASGYLLVVKDPTAFMWRVQAESYPSVPLPPERILGPYDGRLNNAGERVEISMPGDVDASGTRYYIRIDRVNYSDGSHPEDCPGGVDLWLREADGGGKSLARKVPADYGNDVANWKAASPSPGLSGNP